MTDEHSSLIKDYIREKGHLDAIVVEGYDGVGKGRILSELSTVLGVTPYRPDYNLWQSHELKKTDRWKISGYFWDIYSHFNTSSDKVLLFDRGILSGAVYNDDISIAYHYKDITRDMKILNILVTCDTESYIKFQKLRNPEIDEDTIKVEYLAYREYTDRYLKVFKIAGADYIVFHNKFDSSIAEDTSDKCKGCGHYNHGWCRHPVMNCIVDENNKRCNLANTKEVQDIDTEMYSLQSK